MFSTYYSHNTRLCKNTNRTAWQYERLTLPFTPALVRRTVKVNGKTPQFLNKTHTGGGMQIALVDCVTPEQAAQQIIQSAKKAGVSGLTVSNIRQVGPRLLATLSPVTQLEFESLKTCLRFVVLTRDKPD